MYEAMRSEARQESLCEAWFSVPRPAIVLRFQASSFELRASSFKPPSAISPPRASNTTGTRHVPHEEVTTETALLCRASASNKLALRSACVVTITCLVSIVA
jgi:hypothetical protein